MCSPNDEIPKDTIFPLRNLGLHWPVCMVFTAVAKKKWTMGIGFDDQQCPLGNLVLGFVKAPDAFLRGEIHWSILPPGEANAQYSQSIKMLESEKYNALIAAPLDKAEFDPDMILIFASPAQVSKLVQGRLFLTGGALNTTACLGATCSMQVANTILADECQVVLPGSGPRCFGQIQDHEMCFTVPSSKFDLLTEGLKSSTGLVAYDYPPDTVMNYEFEFPPSYKNLQDILGGKGDVCFNPEKELGKYRQWKKKYDPYYK
jgi:uncharacterized protein (DUF169 family)